MQNWRVRLWFFYEITQHLGIGSDVGKVVALRRTSVGLTFCHVCHLAYTGQVLIGRGTYRDLPGEESSAWAGRAGRIARANLPGNALKRYAFRSPTQDGGRWGPRGLH